MMKFLKEKTDESFTLVEMLISVSIISLVFLAAAGIFSQTIGLQRKAGNLVNLQQEANYVLSLMAKDIRANMINYNDPAYPDNTIPSPTSILALKDTSSLSTTIKYDLNLQQIRKNNEPLTSSEVQATILEFYISPSEDPFSSEKKAIHGFPRVTIVLELKSKENTFRVQQTVIQRFSERK